MPTEILDEDKFIELSNQAIECRIKRLPNVVKFKLRTKRRLYTLKSSPERAEELNNKINCEKIDIK
ncbi:MAG: hypothetical protein ACTSVY_08460 [Candidatus Helarchaeota archaeon]